METDSPPGDEPGNSGESAQSDFDALYNSQFKSVAVQLYAYFGDMAEAQDVTQEAFCRAWQRWSTIAHYDDPVAWVRRVAWRLAVSRWRRVRTAVKHAASRSESAVPLEGVRIDLVRALAKLAADHRRAVVLHHMVGLSTAEIAADCGVAEATVRSWLHRGRTALREHLADYQPAEQAPASDSSVPQEVRSS